MESGDHGYGHQRPYVHGLLTQSRCCAETFTICHDVASPTLHQFELGHVETGAECPAFPGDHDGGDVGAVDERRSDLDERLEHRRIEGVHLLWPVEPHLRDPVGHVAGHPLPT